MVYVHLIITIFIPINWRNYLHSFQEEFSHSSIIYVDGAKYYLGINATALYALAS